MVFSNVSTPFTEEQLPQMKVPITFAFLGLLSLAFCRQPKREAPHGKQKRAADRHGIRAQDIEHTQKQIHAVDGNLGNIVILTQDCSEVNYLVSSRLLIIGIPHFQLSGLPCG
jgi:hypothetical protein